MRKYQEFENPPRYQEDFEATCNLMRKYMKKIQPQSFASVWNLFLVQKQTCEIYGIKISDVSDIMEYAKKERIERFGF